MVARASDVKTFFRLENEIVPITECCVSPQKDSDGGTIFPWQLSLLCVLGKIDNHNE